MDASWTLKLVNAAGERRDLLPGEMDEMQVLPHGMRWRGHPDLGRTFQVEITLATGEDGLSSGTLSYSGYEGAAFVEEILFPVLEVPYGDEVSILHAGRDLGVIPRPQAPCPLETEQRFSCQSLSFFALLYAGQKGFYLDARQDSGIPHEVSLRPHGNGQVTLAMVTQVGHGEHPRQDWRMAGSCSWGSYEGGWYEAARLYRPWALSRPAWAARTVDNPLRHIGMWVWNRGLAEDVIPPVLKLQEALPDVPIALDWYWWHHNPYDTDYPFYWPPREGIDAFKAAVATLKRRQIWTQVYMNGICWDMDAPEWEQGGAQEVIRQRDGSPLAFAFNPYNHHRLAYMCGEAETFQNLLAQQVRTLRDCGLSGQYLDMVGACSRLPCFNAAHRHEMGAPSAEGQRTLLKRLRRENPGYPLTTECCTEHCLDLVDGAILCNTLSLERGGQYDEVVPVFPAVYHGRKSLALFGNYALPDGIPPWDPLWPPEDRWQQERPWQELYPEQFFVDVIRNVVFGTQPMVCNLKPSIYEDPAYADVWNFILHIARFYHENRGWLFDGEMLSPAGFECGEKEVKFLCRSIFTRCGEEREIVKRMPVLLHGVWRDEAGRRAMFVGNYTSETQAGCYGGRRLSVPPQRCVRVDLAD